MSSSIGISPGNVTVYHGKRVKVMDRRLKIAEVVLRFFITGLGVLAAALVGSDTQVRQFFTFEKRAKFTDMKSMVLLVITSGITAAYSLFQGLRCLISVFNGSALFNKSLAWAIFSFDQVIAYLLVAAVAATLQSSVLAEVGQKELQWIKVCNLYGKFCTQAGEGIAGSFIASVAMVAVSGISAFNLFRLYGPGKR